MDRRTNKWRTTMRPANKIVVLPEPGPETLVADVAAILASAKLVDRILRSMGAEIGEAVARISLIRNLAWASRLRRFSMTSNPSGGAQSNPNAPGLDDSSSKALTAEVAAILASAELMDHLVGLLIRRIQLSNSVAAHVVQTGLADAWTQHISRTDRLVWRRLYGLDGQAAMTVDQLASNLGRPAYSVAQSGSITGSHLATALCYSHIFPGLPHHLARFVYGQGARSIKDISRLFSGRRIPGLKGNMRHVHELDQWMRENGLIGLGPPL